MKFLKKYPKDIQEQIIEELKAEWTYNSTAIEGNTLSLGETKQVIAGLTIAGHSLKEHKEVYGHVNAIELIDLAVNSEDFRMSLEFLNKLNYAVMTNLIMDVDNPVGELKPYNNGCNSIQDGKAKWLDYSPANITKELMEKWIDLFNETVVTSPQESIEAFAQLHISFTSIHPYSDGNGRMVRLLANVPTLKAGYPPIIINKKNREDYIDILSKYSFNGGIPKSANDDIVVLGEDYQRFETFVEREAKNIYKILFKYDVEKSKKKLTTEIQKGNNISVKNIRRN